MVMRTAGRYDYTASASATTTHAAPGPPLILPPAAADLPELLRAVVCDDGALKANFRDNTVLLLDATGEAVTVHTPDGDTVRQLSRFVVSRFADKLRVALEFRNAHVDVPFCPPVITKRFSRAAPAAPDDASSSRVALFFRCSRRIAVTRWSASAAEARRCGLFTRLAGGGAALESMDRVARVVLSAHGLVAHVTYPLLYAEHDVMTRDDPSSGGLHSPSFLRETAAAGGSAGAGAVDDEDDDVGEDDGDDGAASASTSRVFDYVWHTQTFSADACPLRWAYPVAMLTEVVYAAGGTMGEAGEARAGDAGGHAAAAGATTADARAAVETDGDGGGASPPVTAGSAGSATTLPVSSTAQLVTGFSSPKSSALWVDDSPRADPHSWWSSASLLGYPPLVAPTTRGGGVDGGGKRRSVAVEHVPGMVQWTVRSSRRGQSSQRAPRRGNACPTAAETPADGAETTLAGWRFRSESGVSVETVAALDDGSALVSTEGGRYVRHVPDRPGGAGLAALYRADAVPDRVGAAGAAAAAADVDDDGYGAAAAAERVPIGLFAARLFALRAAAAADVSTSSASAAEPRAAGAPSEPWAVESADVVEEITCAAEGEGRFTAFADGRVRVVYGDRTMLELSRDGSAARLLMPDGERVEVRTQAPMRWAPYVAAAAEFASWAFLSPAEREASIRADNDRRLYIEAEISRTSRFTSIVAGRPLERYDEEAVEKGAAGAAAAAAGHGRTWGGGGGGTATTTTTTTTTTIMAAGVAKGEGGATACRSPLKELRRPPALVVPIDDVMAAAVARRVARFGDEDDDDDGAAAAAANDRHLETPTSENSTRRKGEKKNAEDSVAAVAAAAGDAENGNGNANEGPYVMMSVEEALARTSRWLDGVRDELTPSSASPVPRQRHLRDGGGGDSPGDDARDRGGLECGEGGGVEGHDVAAIDRARLVEEAFAETETWLVNSGYGGGGGGGGGGVGDEGGGTLNFVDAPDF